MTKNFKLAEFTRSAVAQRFHINNTPSAEAVANIRHLCETVLQPFRDHLNVPVVITSGYRCPALNAKVGGVAHSQHLTGEAADIRLPRIPGTDRVDMRLSRKWMEYIANTLPYDQLILERRSDGAAWLHISCCRDHNRNRRKMFELAA